ncbi:hypothetical protein RB653_005284 [Dictyostelium firmibasis]|uniref:Uncharacterized protein n=1 Tax=Dictyostelium firmibasis TaxID=79012 RepID=A0AAN7YZ40_9MYCE
MSDEPLNHKLLARNKHRGGKTVDKNTSRGKYKKQEYEQKKKEREELAKREQDPNYRPPPKKTSNNDNNNGDEENSDDDDSDNSEDNKNENENGEIKFTHSRSKYSKRVLLQNDHSELVKLDEKYYNQGSLLNMQSLIDSKVDFIPKFDNLILFDDDNDGHVNSSNKTKTNNDNSINTSEIEKLLSSIPLSKRLNIDEHYVSGLKLPNPSNIVYLKRKSNKHLIPIESANMQQQQQQEQNKPQKTGSNTPTIINKDNKEIKLSPIVKDTADKPPIDNGNVTSDNLEDWLDSII